MTDAPILEFDPTREAILEPSRLIQPNGMPEKVVLCFFMDVINGLVEHGVVQSIDEVRSEMGSNPIYTFDFEGQRLALLHPGVGAPLAAGFLEEVIALGGRKFIACGGAGVLNKSIAVGHLIVPTSAVRDEGVSYHYLPPSREVSAHPEGVAAIEAVLRAHNVEYLTGKTWTTDAIYRETAPRAEQRKAEGCLTVEMEAASFFAVAQFRGVTFAQILYGGDAVIPDEWDSRGWVHRESIREKLFWLAAESVARL